jgi:DNA-binding YbaB/EbfC family protein
MVMRGNIAQLMQQAQKMQENVQKAQAELASVEVVGSAGGGMVTITLSGRMECRKVRVDPGVLADPEMAEDLIAAAFNDAVARANAVTQEKMGAATAGMPMPPGLQLPF